MMKISCYFLNHKKRGLPLIMKMNLLMATFALFASSFAVHAANDLSTGTQTNARQSNQEAAKETSSGAGMAMAANVAVAGMMAVPCFKPPPDMMACAMMAMSLAQAGADSGAKDAANNTFDGFNNGGPGGGGGSPTTTPRDEFGPFTPDLAKMNILDRQGLYRFNKEQTDKLKSMGVKYDPKDGTVTVPGGKKFSAGNFASAKAMADAGASPEFIDQVSKMNKEIADKFRVSSIGLAGGGGGGGSGGSQRYPASYNDPFAALYGMNREKPKDAQTSGLSRQLASGESIGTKTDSIFEMISRSYKRKTQENVFVSP
jgi:hypothetical protein